MSGEALCVAMFAAMCVLLLAGFPVAFTLAGVGTAFALLGAALDVFDLALLNAIPSRLFALMTREPLVAVPLFVFMGVMLERSRIAHDLLDEMGRVLSFLPGGLAVSVSLVGMLLAASTGIVGATVVMLGLISLPAMLERGYDRAFACGSVAAAGTLGQVIPPSIVLIFLGDQLSIAHQRAQFAAGNTAPDSLSINDLFAAALIPGLVLVGLYVACQIAAAVLRPGLVPQGAAGMQMDGAPSLRRLAGSLLAPLALIVAVLGSMLGGVATATEAASVGAVGAVLLAAARVPSAARPAVLAALCLAGLVLLRATFDLRLQHTERQLVEWLAVAAALISCCGLAWGLAASLWQLHRAEADDGPGILREVLRATLSITSMIFMIVIGASVFALVFRGLGGAAMIEGALGSLPGGAPAALALVIAAIFVLGFFLDFLEIVFMVVPVVAPVLLQMEIAPGVTMSPLWLGVMMAIVLQTSFLTPPFGLSLFYLRGVAPREVRTLDIYRGAAPFVALQLVLLVIVWFAPGMATWLPAVLYGE